MLDVLAYCNNPHAWTPGVRYAAELAASVGASLTGLHVAPPWPSREPRGAPPSLMAELLAHAQEDVSAATRAGPRFDAWARGIGVGSTRWHVALGDPLEVLGVAGNWSDLIVIDRRIGDRDDTCDLISEVLLSGRVCIAVPDQGYSPMRINHIMLLYDGSKSAVRALRAALPLLGSSTQLTLRGTGRLAGDHDELRKRFDPFFRMAARGVRIDMRPMETAEGSLAAIALRTCVEQNVDLLVCGASGTRLDDCRLDEMPRSLLLCTPVPILMAH